MLNDMLPCFAMNDIPYKRLRNVIFSSYVSLRYVTRSARPHMDIPAPKQPPNRLQGYMEFFSYITTRVTKDIFFTYHNYLAVIKCVHNKYINTLLNIKQGGIT